MRIIKSNIPFFRNDCIATKGSRISMLMGFFFANANSSSKLLFFLGLCHAYFILRQLKSTVHIHVAFPIQVLGLNKLKRQSRLDKCKDML